jgi:hypothetical protein
MCHDAQQMARALNQPLLIAGDNLHHPQGLILDVSHGMEALLRGRIKHQDQGRNDGQEHQEP